VSNIEETHPKGSDFFVAADLEELTIEALVRLLEEG